MTFLSVSDTSLAGRTCRAWLHVAYEVTPIKGERFRLKVFGEFDYGCAEGLERVGQMLQSPWMRHYTRLHIFIDYYAHTGPALRLFEVLCTYLPKLTDVKLVGGTKDGTKGRPQLPFLLGPLLEHHGEWFTILTVVNLLLIHRDFEVISKLSALERFRFFEFGAGRNDPYKDHRWSLEELNAFAPPNNQLTNLRMFRFRPVGMLTKEYLDCLKNLPSESITEIVPRTHGAIAVNAVGDFVHFTHLRKFNFRIRRNVVDPISMNARFELMRQVLPELVQLEDLELSFRRFNLGELTTLLQYQTRLTSLTFEDVKFESPTCLIELKPLPLMEIKFIRCSTVRFDHLIKLGDHPSLTRLTHYGESVPPDHVFSTQILTKDEQAALTPPNSVVLPNLKRFIFYWKDEA